MILFTLADWWRALMWWLLFGSEEFDEANDAEDEDQNDRDSGDSECAQSPADHGKDRGGRDV
jgi:hypothetical protein